MYKLIFLIICVLSALNADNLVLKEGKIQAHTEVFGDSSIDPYTTNISSNIQFDNTISSIKGAVWFDSIKLVSDNLDRDKNMYELLNSQINPKISFDFISIKKIDEQNYEIEGYLSLNKVSRKVKSIAKIKKEKEDIIFDGTFDINLTDFNLEPPTLLFLTVRDRIDVKYILDFKAM
ncbi:YceI family protein [Arcobacter sp. YIC-464]|uniref:YceI family protein n=1 Tax=Arcobacter sp. YIC-464 TaxID=3376631 RepID=UPI003C155584